MREAQSPKGALNRTDWRKILIQGGVVVAAALGTYLIEVSTAIDLGATWTPVVMTALAIIGNILRKLGSGPLK